MISITPFLHFRSCAPSTHLRTLLPLCLNLVPFTHHYAVHVTPLTHLVALNYRALLTVLHVPMLSSAHHTIYSIYPVLCLHYSAQFAHLYGSYHAASSSCCFSLHHPATFTRLHTMFHAMCMSPYSCFSSISYSCKTVRPQ